MSASPCVKICTNLQNCVVEKKRGAVRVVTRAFTKAFLDICSRLGDVLAHAPNEPRGQRGVSHILIRETERNLITNKEGALYSVRISASHFDIKCCGPGSSTPKREYINSSHYVSLYLHKKSPDAQNSLTPFDEFDARVLISKTRGAYNLVNEFAPNSLDFWF
jgi:hypothetical protein